MIPLHKLEEHALLPPDVVVQQETQGPNQFNVVNDRFRFMPALMGELPQRAMLLKKPFALGGILDQRKQQALLIIEVVSDLIVPGANECIKDRAAILQRAVGGSLQVPRLNQPVHVFARERLQCFVSLEGWLDHQLFLA